MKDNLKDKLKNKIKKVKNKITNKEEKDTNNTSSKQIKKGFLYGIISLMFSQVLIKILGLIYTMYLTNKDGYGDIGNGISARAYNIYALLLTISSTGVPSAISKIIAEKETKNNKEEVQRIFKIALSFFAIIGLIGSFILYFGARYIADCYLKVPESYYTLIALSPAVFIVSVASVFRGYFNGRCELGVTAKSQSIEQIYKCILTLIMVEFVCIKTHKNTTLMAATANLATTLSTFVGLFYLVKYYKIVNKDKKQKNEYDKKDKEKTFSFKNIIQKLKLNNLKNINKDDQVVEINIRSDNTVEVKKEQSIFHIIKTIIIVAFPITITAIMTSFSKLIDSGTVVPGLLNFMDNKEAINLFGIFNYKVDTLTNMPLALNVAFSTALLPAIASAKARKDNKSITEKSSMLLLLSMIIGLPCTIGMIALGNPILHLLFPNQSSGALILQTSAIAIIFTILGQNLNAILQGLGKLYIPIISLLSGLFIKFICNKILIPIPEFGIYGAVIGSNLCQILAFIISYIFVIKNIKLDLPFKTFILKPLIASFAMGGFAYLFYCLFNLYLPNSISCVISILIAVCIYVFLVVVLKIFNKDQILQLPKGDKILLILNKCNLYN